MMSASRPLRAAIYARYSSDLQREASLEDQIRLCRKMCDDNGWRVTETFQDRAVSGSFDLRAEFQRLRRSALKGQFDVVVAEALDRFSRDQEHIAGFHKQMSFHGVRIVTKSEGEINEMHIGLGGTMAALYIKHLAEKTHRGLEGRVRDGKSAGGISYGYKVDRHPLPDGSFSADDRVIHASEAAIVQRIFRDYAAGRSARTIAIALNAEGTPSPGSGRSSGTWSFSTIGGNWKRGTGILNNEMYIGRLVWNRLRYRKDPTTGKRVSRLNPPEEWVVEDVPHLAIVDQGLWDKVKARQKATREGIFDGRAGSPDAPCNERAHRPRYLLSDLIRCGRCGGGYSMVSRTRLGCSTARNKGTCDNRLNIRRDALEASILNGLRKHLMEPELFKEFCAEFTKEVNRLRTERGADFEGWKQELKRVDKELDKIVDAILEGFPPSKLKDKAEKLEARKAELADKLANADEPPPLMHPNMAGLYAQRIGQLYEHLQDEDGRTQAAETFRSLVDQVTLVPDSGELAIVLSGDLGAILRFAAGKKNPDFLSEAEALDNLLSQGSLVAGVRNRRSLRNNSDDANAHSDEEVSPGSLVAGTRSRRPLRNGSEQQKTSSAGALEVSQVSLVAGAGFNLCPNFSGSLPVFGFHEVEDAEQLAA